MRPGWLGRREPAAPQRTVSQASQRVAIHLRAVRAGLNLRARRLNRATFTEDIMAWKTPKIVEVSVGMEINMYACAARK
jgi:coenzyme PQQ precursor peptide PqqA